MSIPKESRRLASNQSAESMLSTDRVHRTHSKGSSNFVVDGGGTSGTRKEAAREQRQVVNNISRSYHKSIQHLS